MAPRSPPAPAPWPWPRTGSKRKTFLNAAGAPTVAFEAVNSAAEAVAAVARLGVPCLLKTRRDGYDGKGQRWVRDPAEAAAAFQSLGAPCILEAPADFRREVSMVCARGRDGRVATYPGELSRKMLAEI